MPWISRIKALRTSVKECICVSITFQFRGCPSNFSNSVFVYVFVGFFTFVLVIDVGLVELTTRDFDLNPIGVAFDVSNTFT